MIRYIWILLSLITLQGLAQTKIQERDKKIDSLNYVISNVKSSDTSVVDSYFRIALIYYLEDPDTASYFCNKALERSLSVNFDRGIADGYSWLGYLAQVKSEYKKAIYYYNQSYIIAKKRNNKSKMAYALNYIGVINFSRGNPKEAQVFFEASIALEKENGKKRSDYVATLNSLTNLYLHQGEIEKAIKLNNEVIEISKEKGNHRIIGIAINSAAYLNGSQGDYEKAEELYTEALVHFEEINDLNSQGRIYANLGQLYKKQTQQIENLDSINKRYEKYYYYNNKALDIFRSLGSQNEIAVCLNNKGTIFRHKKEFDSALLYFNKSLKIRETIQDLSGISNSYLNIGVLHYKLKDYDKSLLYIEKSNKINTELKYPLKLKSDLKMLKNIYYKKNYKKDQVNGLKIDSIASDIIKIDNHAIISNFSVLSESNQEIYFKTIEEDYMDFNSYALYRKDNNPEIVSTVYNNTIKNKGLQLKSSTAMRNAIYNSKDSTLIQTYNDWIFLKKQISNHYSKGKDAKKLEEEANEKEKDLIRKSQLFSNFKKLQLISWKDIQKNLKPNEIAIEFIHFKYKDYSNNKIDHFTDSTLYCALVINNECLHPEMIPLFYEKELESVLNKYQGNNLNYINHVYGTNDKPNNSLYNLIWKPLEKNIKNATKIIISPSGLLHKISFPALSNTNNIYLCDELSIDIKSSTAKLIKNKNNQFSDKFKNVNTTIFGGIVYQSESAKKTGWNYLKGTKKETDEIFILLEKKKNKVNYHIGTKATETKFKNTTANSRIIHIATHGFFYPDPKALKKDNINNESSKDIVFRGITGYGYKTFVDNPNPLMRSGLVFANANKIWSQTTNNTIDDGVLTSLEVAHLDLRNTELVVLSACETGLGEINGSEGVYGLQRAFKMAGVKNIIMSLWQVPDEETREFMTLFYKNLFKTHNVSSAFNKTQKQMRQKYDIYFWGAFVLLE